jgi:hypothetical protein
MYPARFRPSGLSPEIGVSDAHRNGSAVARRDAPSANSATMNKYSAGVFYVLSRARLAALPFPRF